MTDEDHKTLQSKQIWTPDIIALATGERPEYLVQGRTGSNFVVAKWNHPSSRIVIENATHHILCYHVTGNTSVYMAVDGKTVGTNSRPGTVTFIRQDHSTELRFGARCSFLHVYISPKLLRQFSKRYLGINSVPIVDTFVAIEEPWLQGYFQMLISQLEIFRTPPSEPDTLLLTRSQYLLIRHLVYWHSNLIKQAAHKPDGYKHVSPLRTIRLKRILDFIDTHLKRDIRLEELAQIANMSKDHFIRAFREAIGTTPFQLIREKRLQLAAKCLRNSDRQIVDIAHCSGFANPSHFSARFRARYGLSPMDYRRLTNNTNDG